VSLTRVRRQRVPVRRYLLFWVGVFVVTGNTALMTRQPPGGGIVAEVVVTGVAVLLLAKWWRMRRPPSGPAARWAWWGGCLSLATAALGVSTLTTAGAGGAPGAVVAQFLAAVACLVARVVVGVRTWLLTRDYARERMPWRR
jgi:hypothetical protein